jgi:hypothetical protein
MNKYLKHFILILSLVAIVIGVSRGEVIEVLNKAIYICLECIGIG